MRCLFLRIIFCLVSDPRLDDKVFVSVHQVLRSHPLPTLVRCLESFYHDDEVSAVYAGDVIEVSGVETDDEDRVSAVAYTGLKIKVVCFL